MPRRKQHGGPRPGSGRPPIEPAGAGRRHTIYLLPSERDLLVALGGSLSAGVRFLIQQRLHGRRKGHNGNA